MKRGGGLADGERWRVCERGGLGRCDGCESSLFHGRLASFALVWFLSSGKNSTSFFLFQACIILCTEEARPSAYQMIKEITARNGKLRDGFVLAVWKIRVVLFKLVKN